MKKMSKVSKANYTVVFLDMFVGLCCIAWNKWCMHPSASLFIYAHIYTCVHMQAWRKSLLTVFNPKTKMINSRCGKHAKKLIIKKKLF